MGSRIGRGTIAAVSTACRMQRGCFLQKTVQKNSPTAFKVRRRDETRDIRSLPIELNLSARGQPGGTIPHTEVMAMRQRA